MPWIKSHLHVVIAGSVGLLGLVGLVLGFVLPDVKAEMSQDQGLISSLESLKGAPAGAIDQRRREQINNRGVLVSDQAKFVGKDRGAHQPLPSAASLFPKPDPSKGTAGYYFVQEFKQRQKALLTMLNAKDKPTPSEIAETQIALEKLKSQQKFETPEARGGVGRATLTQPAPGPTGPGGFGSWGGGFLPMPGSGLGPDATPEQRMKEDPLARASVNKAHTLWCYASLESLDQRPAITSPEVSLPLLDDMWYAQFSLWVQEDILGAMAALNKKAAEALAPEDRWVGNMPFKHLKSFYIGGFVPPAAPAGGVAMPSLMAQVGGTELGGPPPMSATEVMTKHGSTPDVDRIQFTMDVVIDAKALYYVIDAISTCGFYTVLQVSYEAVPPNPTLADYIYGPRPALHVWLLVEGSFLRNKYDKDMPESVKKAIQAGSPIVGAGGVAPTSGGGYGGPSRFMGSPGNMPLYRGGPEGPMRGHGRPGRDEGP